MAKLSVIVIILALYLLLVQIVPVSPVESEKTNSNLAAGNMTTLILGGDVMLGRTVTIESLAKDGPTYPFINIANTLRNADITFVNLENPITETCPRHTGGFTFCAPPKMLKGLTYAGIDIVSLANNHTLNYGNSGFEETKKHLQEFDIEYVGDNPNLVIKEVGETSFGFLGFEKSQQMSPKLTAVESTQVQESGGKVDVLVVAMHWGVEYKDKALPGVRTLARELVELGADVVVGHHPHWVQDYEHIDGKPIYYSLGNLVFDQMWSEKTREGLLVKLTFENKKVIKEEFIETYMEKHAQPSLVTE